MSSQSKKSLKKEVPASEPSVMHISQDTIKRLARDVRNIRKNPLDSNGIYYHHDEENILKGYAMIIGPPDTIYEGGYYFFEFNYPSDYPASPPKVTFRTNKDRVRFNPNLYTSGKVCLSMLNTWRGEQWTSCQTISTVLLTICTIFTNTPLLNEPGVTSTHRDFRTYHRIIEYKNIEIAIMDIVNKHSHIYLPFFDYFYENVMEHFKSNASNIQERIRMLKSNNSANLCVKAQTSLYSMLHMLDYAGLETTYQAFYDKHMGVVSKCKPSSGDGGKEKPALTTRSKKKAVTKKVPKSSSKLKESDSAPETPKETDMLDLLDLLESDADNSVLPSDVHSDENIFLLEDSDTNLLPPPTPVKKTRAKKGKLKQTI
uniref:Ubiquitin-conjugating enzyme E2 Z n=1 Tax=viral metagenome TaxID=1070528 RepID=A0A6C0FEG2_9ZZZZ|tara:strand:- start:788 stop:1903 length:1116 start_codon:yes stop_codon:yes gene_type:complete